MTHDHPPPQRISASEEMRNTFNFVVFFTTMHSMPLLAMFRKAGTCGHRFFGVHAFWALFYVPVFCAFTAQRGSLRIFVLLFVAVYLISLFRHRMKSLRLRRNGTSQLHSCYVGESAITGFPQCCTEESRRSVAEPLFAILLAMVLLVFGPMAFPVAAYFFVGAVCLVVNETIMMRNFEAQTQAMIDAAWDNRIIAQGYRNRTGRN